MSRAGFEPETPAIDQPQSYVLDRAVTGINCGVLGIYFEKFRNSGLNLILLRC